MTDAKNEAASGASLSDAVLTVTTEHEELVQLAVELRELLLDDANGMMQGAMVGSPVECIAFAKWWIQRQKGLKPDQEWFDVANACGKPGHD